MAFYKRFDNTLIKEENYIFHPDYTLLAEEHELYTYPVDGWWWFETDEEAILALLDPPEEGEPEQVDQVKKF